MRIRFRQASLGNRWNSLCRMIVGVLVTCFIESSALGEEPVDFKNDLMPVFTKYGCNAGACHGAAIGRGGFKLSLYGGNPDADYDAVVREVSGRRVNLSAPDESLIFLKPTEFVEHGGGGIFREGEEAAQLLVEWIRQGATQESERELRRVEVSPQRHFARSLGERIPLQAVAHYSDGSMQDVTRWTVFAPEDVSAVEIVAASELEPATESSSISPSREAELDDKATGAAAIIRRRGRHIVVARFLTEVMPLELVVPLTDERLDLSSEPRSNFIDDEILNSLEGLGLQPSEQIGDAGFIRRATLDLTGRLPTVERLESFVASEDSNKRKVLIEELLAGEAATEYWTFQLATLFRLRPPQDDLTGTEAYYRWLSEQVRGDVSYQQLARELITASGDTHDYGPANFYRTTKGPREQAEFVSELLMGTRLRCANCHNHPLDRWTQDDYHGLAAIFAKVESGRVISDKPSGIVTHPRTLEAATAKIPGVSNYRDDAPAEQASRQQLAAWLTDRENPYFAKAIVNRLWKRMMGRGLVEPVDDFRSTNPATHPDLLNKLAEDFAENGFSLRHTLSVIANSSAYSRNSTATNNNKDDDRFYSHALRRPLQPEVLADAISDVLGVASRYGEEPLGTRAVTLINPREPSITLDVLGRCDRTEGCESDESAIGSLTQKLHLFNGPLLNARIAAPESRLTNLLAEQHDALDIVDEFYRVALARHPSSEERRFWALAMEYSDDHAAWLEDFVWSLMSSREFVTNH